MQSHDVCMFTYGPILRVDALAGEGHYTCLMDLIYVYSCDTYSSLLLEYNYTGLGTFPFRVCDADSTLCQLVSLKYVPSTLVTASPHSRGSMLQIIQERFNLLFIFSTTKKMQPTKNTWYAFCNLKTFLQHAASATWVIRLTRLAVD